MPHSTLRLFMVLKQFFQYIIYVTCVSIRTPLQARYMLHLCNDCSVTAKALAQTHSFERSVPVVCPFVWFSSSLIAIAAPVMFARRGRLQVVCLPVSHTMLSERCLTCLQVQRMMLP